MMSLRCALVLTTFLTSTRTALPSCSATLALLLLLPDSFVKVHKMPGHLTGLTEELRERVDQALRRDLVQLVRGAGEDFQLALAKGAVHVAGFGDADGRIAVTNDHSHRLLQHRQIVGAQSTPLA